MEGKRGLMTFFWGPSVRLCKSNRDSSFFRGGSKDMRVLLPEASGLVVAVSQAGEAGSPGLIAEYLLLQLTVAVWWRSRV